MEIRQLIELALEARDKSSYTPYSHFKVGAAVEMEGGAVYTGGNIENAAFTPSNCAERTAIFKGVSEGKRRIRRIAIVADGKDTFPCGVCRQVIREFGDNPEIIIANTPEEYQIFTLEELLPHSFGPEDLEDAK